MKKLISILLTLTMILGLCACSGSGTSKDNTLQAGFARVACLPDSFPVHIAGNDAAADVANNGFLDELSVTCIALKQGEQTVLIYTCDVVDIDGAFYKETEQAITDETGIPASQIILNATHTHSAPTLKSNLPGKVEYLAKFNKSCAQAGKKAIEDLSAATLSYGSVQTENMTFVRHYNMADGTTYGNGHGDINAGIVSHHYDSDGEAQVIRIKRAAEDKKDIVMMNLGAHATYINGNQDVISADFPGVARQYVEQNADVHCAYFIAASGDQTPKSKVPGQTYHQDHTSHGTALGEYVVKCLETMTDATAGDMQLYTETYTAKRMKEGTEDPTMMAHATEIMTLYKANGNSYSGAVVQSKIKEYGFTSFYEAQGLITRANAPATGSFDTNTMAIGNVGIVFAPYEMFSTQGKTIKETSPMDMTFIITCSEDDQAYIPSELACEHSYYEYDVTPYARGTGEALAERYVQILTALKEGNTPAALPPV